MGPGPSITITQIEGYKFAVDFGSVLPLLIVDEAVPIGNGEGPFPEQILVSAVTNCLCASLVFALAKFKQEAEGIRAEARCEVTRNAENRLRITGIAVSISLGARAEAVPRIDRVLEQFQRFCTVSESVQAGIPVTVAVRDGAGTLLT
ncbi:OsmC family protein [Methylobacterium sp. J-068]|uniref:OsmC family protein n=1 Tax=Methylobacterium sp. J-068 TaxID=2836649 RepID=UPI001FB9074E|nr:OsmC family protein [Methylobacterium sp. J-068]MCJ2034004.1 OsmC family protein [Methylobacterium sp. J-068]